MPLFANALIAAYDKKQSAVNTIDKDIETQKQAFSDDIKNEMKLDSWDNINPNEIHKYINQKDERERIKKLKQNWKGGKKTKKSKRRKYSKKRRNSKKRRHTKRKR